MSPLIPIATYHSPDIAHNFHPGDGPHTTNGKTTQISDIVIQAGGEDRDKPSSAKNTELGDLRSQLTSLQDQINIFLTERMNAEKNKSNKQNEEDDIERRILDDGVDEDDSD